MEPVQGADVRPSANIPRLSRLPMPRAPTNVSHSQSQHDDPSKPSGLPRAVSSAPRKSLVRPLGESNNSTFKPKYGFGAQPTFARPRSPVRSTNPSSQDANLDNTPPAARDQFSPVDGDENAAVNALKDLDSEFSKPHAKDLNKRKPRPSLSERTIETLSQMSPSPSPTRRRRRSSVATKTSDGSMGPPSRPTTALRITRPATPPSMRSPSPTKRPFRPPGKPPSPSKQISAVPTVLENQAIYTPPRVMVRDISSRIAQPSRDVRRSLSTAVTDQHEPSANPSTQKQAVKVKSMHNLREAATNRSLKSKASMSSLIKTLSETPMVMNPKNHHRDISPHTRLLKPRSPGENVIATSPTLRPTSIRTPASHKRPAKSVGDKSKGDLPATVSSASKSSAALRESIAKAKAARKASLQSSQNRENEENMSWNQNDVPPVTDLIVNNPRSFKKKLEAAITSGTLNLSAMSLSSWPPEIATMYELGENSKVNWSEAVDLVKLLAADNELEELPDSSFLDWTEQEMLDDPEKNNQFAGLEILDLHGNKLRSLPTGFRRLGQLHSLNVSNNQLGIDVLPLISEIKRLSELKLAKNKICGTLPLELCTLSNLRVLDLRDNQLTEIPDNIASLGNLQILQLSGNKLRKFPIKLLEQLRLIDLDVARNLLSGTLVESRGFQSTSLQTFDFSGNALESLGDGAFICPGLQTFAVHTNRLHTLPDLSQCQQLRTLTAGENRLTEFPSGFFELKMLRTADFSANELKVIDHNLVHMDNLTALNLGGNPLRERKYLTMNIGDIRNDIMKKLGPASFGPTDDSSQIADAPDMTSDANSGLMIKFKPEGGVLDLSSLNLAAIDISQIDFTNGSSVHTIRLSHNDLTVFPQELLSHPSVRNSLKALNLSHNPNLHSTDYLTSQISLPTLRSLYIVSTGLQTLEPLTSYLSAPELRELNISCHRLTGPLPHIREAFPSLTTLLATDNWFSSIDVEAARGLEVLNVCNNEIESLPPKIGLLGNLPGRSDNGRLKIFECSGNRFRVPRLAVIEKGSEAVLKDLRRMISASEVPEEWQ